MKLEKLLSLPKIHLHCHLDGSVRPNTMLELMKQDGYMGKDKKEEFINKIAVLDKTVSLEEYLKKFEIPISVMQSKENLKRIAYELIEDCNSENIKYIEIRFAPWFHCKNGLAMEDVIQAVIDGANEGKAKFDVEFNLIICLLRHESYEVNKEQLYAAKKFLGSKVVAIDLAGDEQKYPADQFVELFDKAKSLGFHITIHAGETGNFENIDKSIELLHAERIGHGTAAIKSEKTMKILLDKNIPLEVCVTSNYNTGIVDRIIDHPIYKYIKKNLIVTVNTDNNTVSNTTLTNEYIKIISNFRLTDSEVINTIENAISFAFCDEGTKDKLRQKLLYIGNAKD
ncbi:adenosine deaminase [Clostridium folliculivorans]|uniref:adenosine deaminase n=1 Tax=Clostridium folliculivorans TaxID=2886038 RepID=A0A9W6DAU5_9CLOT|nr:adenosine deaminase [Clostridium folliculivorans]GKU25740.1 adenosine deaminase [Clostridium folliculivorans]GKU28762.1 adenosine deaminase [Clostridium folliculivorans]